MLSRLILTIIVLLVVVLDTLKYGRSVSCSKIRVAHS